MVGHARAHNLTVAWTSVLLLPWTAIADFDSGSGGDLDARRILMGKPCDSSWSGVGGGVDGDYVFALKVFDDGNGAALYAGGGFDSAGNMSANNIARWSGENWSELGDGVSGLIESLTVFDDGGGAALYVGGAFLTAGGETASNIARWDGESWSPLGGFLDEGVDDVAWAMTVFNDGEGEALYAGGYFTTAGGLLGPPVEVNRIARWDGESWSALGSGMRGEASTLVVHTLTVFDDGNGPALYAGGRFTIAGDVEANRIARWDGQSWSALGSGMDGVVLDMTVFDDGSGPALYAGGGFDTAGGVEASNIARWDGESWSALGSGLDGSGFVDALTVFDEGGGAALYVGGLFFTAGGESANNIARWDGQSWSPLGQGVGGAEGLVRTLSVFDEGGGSSLFAGGVFSSAGGQPADHIATWACPLPCPWDLDDDGQIGAADLAQLLGNWGPCDGCPMDFDGNGQVDAFDLAQVLGAWGECP